MKKRMYQDEFEQFLQDEIGQHRMFPSDHIWKNIRTELHGHRSWSALTFISIFIITTLTISTLVSNHPSKQPVFRKISPQIKETRSPATITTKASHQQYNYFEKSTDGQITKEIFANILVLAGNTPTPEKPLAENSSRIDLMTIPAERIKLSSAKMKTDITGDIADHTVQTARETLSTDLSYTAADKENSIISESPAQAMMTDNKYNPNIPTTAELLKIYTASSVAITKKNPKFGFQIYFAPSTSYRKLSDKKVKEVVQPAINAQTPIPNIPPSSTTSTDVNSVVRHRPAVGIEMGFALLYKISPAIKLKTGLQVNVRKYYIETFQSRTNEQASVSIINQRGVETINLFSPYNNNTGYKQTQLDNKIYQLSVPIGIQWDIIRGSNIAISAEASVQPTMTLNNNTTYLLSTDYKHYADGSQFMRKWNINTNIGLNLSYKSGSAVWQIGPQIRYQHLPTYSHAYPITEYLMDYGVRLGFTKQLYK